MIRQRVSSPERNRAVAGGRSAAAAARGLHGRVLCGAELSVVLLWVAVLAVGEYAVFHAAVGSCRWPSIAGVPRDRQVRALLVADPQLTDLGSYPVISNTRSQDGKVTPSSNPVLRLTGAAALQTVQFYSDLYMRKCFQLAQRYHRPDAVFFLGDLFDSGKILSDDEYAAELQRFRHAFEPARAPSPGTVRRAIVSAQGHVVDAEAKAPTDAPTPHFFLSGNHDLGYALGDAARHGVLAERFALNFGPLNQVVRVRNVSFVMVAATALEPHGSHPAVHAETQQFVRSFDGDGSGGRAAVDAPVRYTRPHGMGAAELQRWRDDETRVLLTHIPLYRPPDTDCGPLRGRSRALKDRAGFSYRNMLPDAESQQVLAAVRPHGVFSGDDHDQCRVMHAIRALGTAVFEQTVGTFSCFQGNTNPSFVLLTAELGGENRVETAVCFLPNQMLIWGVYFALLLPSSAVLAYAKLTNTHARTAVKAARMTPMHRRVMALDAASRATWPYRLAQMFHSTWACVLSVSAFYVLLLWLAA